MSEQGTFELGIVMAGAVSGGAYQPVDEVGTGRKRPGLIP